MTSFNDWVTLRKLVPSHGNNQFTYSLMVRCTDIGCRTSPGHVDFDEQHLHTRFSQYGVSRECFKEFNKTKVLRFPSFFQAYRAWVETNKSMWLGHPLVAEPTGGSLGNIKVHMVLVSRLPKQMTMTTFVTRFVRYSGLLFVDARPREDCAILGYSEQSSVEKACSDVVKVKVDGTEFSVVVEPLQQRPPKSVPSVLKAVEAYKLKKGLSETAVASTVAKSAGGSEEAESTSNSLNVLTNDNGVHKHNSDRMAAEQRASQFSNGSQNSSTSTLSSLVCNAPHKQAPRKHAARTQHRFSISGDQYREMFKACDAEPPEWGDTETAARVIKFVIVNQEDSIRFWAWLWDNDGQNARDLAELEKYIRHTAPGSSAPAAIPQHGERGIALDRINSHSWFRCYILNVDTKFKILTVFFCDYGIVTHIPKECFRYTAKVVWSLPPQAIPLQLFGYALTEEYDPDDVETRSLLRGNVLKADVKVASSHVVHINNILDHSGICIDEDIIRSCGKYIRRKRNKRLNKSQGESKDGQNIVKNVETLPESHSVKPPSLFDYEPENLQLALLTEVCDHNLIYLRTNFEGDLQLKLDKCRLQRVPSIRLAEGDTAMLSNEAVNHRVIVLQISKALNKLKVAHVDHGNVEWVSADDLYELPRDIKDYPYQATAAALGGVVIEMEKVEEAIVFLKTREKSMVRVKFVSRVGGVELFDADTNRSLNLEMVQRGLASVDDKCPVKQDLGTLESPISDTSSHNKEYKSADRVQDLDIRSLVLETRGRVQSDVRSGKEVANCLSSSLDNSALSWRSHCQKESRTIQQTYQPPKQTQQQQQQQQATQPQPQPRQNLQEQQEQQQQQQYQQQRQRKPGCKQQQRFSSQQTRKDESHSNQLANKQTRNVYRRQDDTLAVNVKNVPPPPDIVISTNFNKQRASDFQYHKQLVRGRGRSLSLTQ